MESALDMGLRSVMLRKLAEAGFSEIRENYGLKMVEIDVLYYLSTCPQGDTPTGIYQYLHLNKGHISQAVDGLWRKEYLQAQPDPEDRRSIHYRVTAKAVPVLEDIRCARQRLAQTMFRGLSPEALHQYRTITHTIFRNLTEGCGADSALELSPGAEQEARRSTMENKYSQITPYIQNLSSISRQNNKIVPEMYQKYSVKRGLRDENGNGVVTGLTEISEIVSKVKDEQGNAHPCEGQLYYRGVNVRELVSGFLKDDRFGFEETVYLLLFSRLPNDGELEMFRNTINDYRTLPPSFVRDMILKAPSRDGMNSLSRSVLALYSYDDNPDDISQENVLRQCLQLISMFPLLAVYGYQAYNHYHLNRTLYIRNPAPELSTAENILRMLRKNGKFTHLEAKVLDLALVLHAEHGGGNNSSFTTHVVSSSGTDTYSAIAAALGSLKGPRHGGANIKVVQMLDDLRKHANIHDEGSIRDYLVKVLDKEAFDRSGLIYGMGHAVYSISDPRADILKSCARDLSAEKGCQEDFAMYETVARLATEIIAEKRKIYKGVSPNVDFYSGMVYRMLKLPEELFTPIFAVSRVAGWSAHRIEELQNNGKIIRPAYINVKPKKPYIPLADR